MPELSLNCCPLCSQPLDFESVFQDSGLYLLSCSCGLNFSPGLESKRKFVQLWNTRFVPSETIQMVIDSELSQPREDRISFLKSGTFFYWLSCILFSLMLFSSPPSADYATGFPGVFFCFGFYALIKATFLFVNNPSNS